MPDNIKTFSDNEYIILSEIIENQNITQRELSKKLGISVSTVNVLVNKMIREGLIKMTQVTQKQVLYMLTPKGMMEKAQKTVSYLKAHYRAIYQTKEKIKDIFYEFSQLHDAIFVLMEDDEMSEVVSVAIDEMKPLKNNSQIIKISRNKISNIENYQSPVLVYLGEINEIKMSTESEPLQSINLLEKL